MKEILDPKGFPLGFTLGALRKNL